MDDQDTIREWLKQVPHKLLAAENGRRNNARRRNASGGRPKVLRPCAKCSEQMGARDLIRHAPTCAALLV
jgi:hypothetical protein